MAGTNKVKKTTERAIKTAAYGFACGAVLVSVAANASSKPAIQGEVIVKLRYAVDSTEQARNWLNLDRIDPSAKIQVISSEQGLVHVSGDNNKLFEVVAQDQVERGIPNIFYNTQLKLNAEITASKSDAVRMPQSLPIPAFDATPPAILSPKSPVSGLDPLKIKDWAIDRVKYAGQVIRSGLTIGVIDTGVDYNHEDLNGAMWRRVGTRSLEVGRDFANLNEKNPNEVVHPYDFRHFDIEGCMKDFMCKRTMGDPRFMSNPGHGTHVAGRLGAMAGNSRGSVGSGAGARIMALKAFYNPGTSRAGRGSDMAIVKSIDYAIANNAKVLNLSLGARLPRSAGEQSTMKQAMIRARDAGLILVVAAGNDGLSNDLPEESTFPAGYTDLDNLITVAASDENDNLARFSNYGTKSVHIAAPGTKILSTVPNGYSQTVAEFTDDQGRKRTIYWDGTSMAAPMVAGVVAQVWAKYPKLTYKQVIQKVLSSSRKVPNLAGRIQTGGVVDMVAALR